MVLISEKWLWVVMIINVTMRSLNHLLYVLGCLLMLVVQTSCSVIDEDLSDCAPQASLNYDLQLVTNMTTELQTELTTQTDILLANEIKQYLSDIFSDFAHDVDLSFYDTEGDSALLQKDKHIMDANQASYVLNLPMRQYMHLAAANVVDNELVTVANDNYCHRSQLSQVIRDTIDSHTTGVFTARQPMEVLGDVSQNFNVHLYMANCAAALVIDPRDRETLEDIHVYSTGFATGFNICDSIYQYDRWAPIVRTSLVGLDRLTKGAFISVNFPSKEPASSSTRNVIETEEPFIAEPGEETLWEFRAYVPHKRVVGTRTETTVTETVLRVKEPLRAGQFKIINCWVGPNDEIRTQDPDVSTSITFDWNPGLEF